MADFIQQMLTANQQLSQPSELQKFVQSLANQQQEPPDTKQRIDDAILSTTMPQAPNSYQLGFARGLLALKDKYMTAPKGENGDEDRKAAQTQANFIRDVANSAGLDLSGYGAGVTREDAAKNLATQEARDVMAALNGQYSKTSDQYYTDTYYSLLQEGYSPRQARKFAGNRAREYQANRVAYLDGVYNSYGRDGLVTNTLGNQMLAQLGMENPSLANFYANSYPGAKDAYQQENQLAQLALSNESAMARMAQQFYLNQQAADAQQQRDDRSFTYRAGVTDKYAQDKENRDEARATRTAQRNFEMGFQKILGTIQFAKNLGLSDDDVNAITRAAFGLKDGGDKAPESAKVLLNFYKNSQETIQKQIDSIIKQYGGSIDGMPDEAKKQVAELQAQIQAYQEAAEIVVGLRQPKEFFKFKNTDTGTQINETLARIYKHAEGDIRKFQLGVRNTINGSQLTDKKKAEILRIASVYNEG